MIPERQTFLPTAVDIGLRLARDAMWEGDRCNWFGPVLDPALGDTPGIGTLGPTLYDGTAGIGLFLARLHSVAPDPVVAGTTTAAITHALARAHDAETALQRGFYTGWVGIAHAAIEAGQILGRDDFVERGLALVDEAAALGEGRVELDVMAGYAGAIPIFLRLARDFGRDSLAAAAVAGGDRLLARGVAGERGLSWDTLGEMATLVDLSALGPNAASSGRPHLTGLSHGAGGIALALVELAAATGEARFAEAAREAFRYEDSWFDARLDAWPDLRADLPGPGTPYEAPSAWCHGAAGIGLTRIRAYEVTRDVAYLPTLQRACRVAARSILARLGRGGANFSLCHGVGGDIDLFLLVARTLGDAQGTQLAVVAGGVGIERHGSMGVPWPSGIEGGAHSPTLMLGLAGTGYFYLRLAAPEAVPSILIPGAVADGKSGAADFTLPEASSRTLN
jgi:lantibiotic modifying enzyme